MARMAIENRSEIGTLKALGFSNHEVRLKFIIYSSFATLIGGIVGAIIGYRIIPDIIVGVFKMMHNIPEIVYSTNVMPIILGILLSVICIVGSTIITINNLVKEKTTSLLRPIAPPIGKKILLEKKPFLWDRLRYSNKLTIRNIFRYKRRILMSIFGIASCTMILLSGYGIKDSIAYVVDNYIMKEEFIITILGILVGLVIGTLYAYMLIDSIEINTMQYIKDIHLDSYLKTFGCMMIFTAIVSVGVHIALKKINLIESLKSVE